MLFIDGFVAVLDRFVWDVTVSIATVFIVFLFALVYCVEIFFGRVFSSQKNSSSEHTEENQVHLNHSLEQGTKHSALKPITRTIHLNLQRKIYAFFQ